ncbi:Zn-dependent hydrolase [Paenibacillus albidus]|uniref:Zn-dependent hydrolase n=1 Tax=Paenibacillus albidus TaxID=2041023 RepID=UPI001BEACC5A|nr:Zn-dependent hydrolase [Paenibacillus albidus]MBT2289737.1 Zn-dependent hydrolase [Paenibacillus albidus]
MKAGMPLEYALEMQELLEELALFSAPGPGVTRLLYTPQWREAQLLVLATMSELGLEVRSDPVGNVYGRLEGADPAAKVIVTGSHIDTVVSGGKYDGAYGIAAAVMALGYLRRTFGQPLRTLEAVSFCEEEGSRFPLTFWGSGQVTGLYDGSEAEGVADAEGVTLAAALSGCGLGGEEEAAGNGAVRIAGTGKTALRSDIGAFVELHIEQGVILEKTATQIGIVQAIAGQRRFTVTLDGTANHAGTTPMHMRQDALAGAAEMLMVLERAALEAGEPLVATAGRLEVKPNTPNVIPGEVLFTLDIRHSEEDALERFCNRVISAYEEIAERRGLKLTMTRALCAVPALMDSGLYERLERICREQGRTHRRMVSGAGHDAQLFAPRCRTAMIFVPSRAGISHSPEEYTSPGELAAGLEVLTALLYDLAYKEIGI